MNLEHRRTQVRGAVQSWRARNPEKAKEATRLSVRKIRLAKHGWTLEEFDRAWEAQGGCCAVCARAMLRTGSRSNSVAADHDHKTGLARALLCIRCNTLLGRLEGLLRLIDGDVPFLKEFDAYLRKHSPGASASLDRLARVRNI